MKGAIYSLDGRFTGQLIAGSDEALMRRMLPAGCKVWVYDGSPPDLLRHRVVCGELVACDLPSADELLRWQWGGEPPLEVARGMAVARIDEAAGRARARYITTSPGQNAAYATKYAEALAYRSAGYPEDLSGYPYIAGESAPRADRSAREAADRIIHLGGRWGFVIGPQIEATRVNGKDRVSRLNRPAEVVAAMEEVVAALDAI